MKLILQQSHTDPEMLELVTARGDKKILWAVVHNDILEEFNSNERQYLEENGEIELEL